METMQGLTIYQLRHLITWYQPIWSF